MQTGEMILTSEAPPKQNGEPMKGFDFPHGGAV